MCDSIRQFEKIENDLPFVILNENNDLQKQLGFFLNTCFNHLKDCPSVDVVFPMFYQLTNWNPFSTELINPLSYLSRYDDVVGFEIILKKQLAISKQSEQYSFTRQLLEIQNNPQNKKRFNIIISNGNHDLFKNDKCNLKFCFNSLFVNGSNLSGDKLKVVNIKQGRETEEVISFSPPELPESIEEDVLKKMYIPSYIHTIYLKKGYKIYYIFSNCVSEFKANTCDLESTYGLGGIFVLMKDIYRPEQEKEFIEVLERITDKVANRIVNYFQLTLVQKHATRAAISQVMARNTSHNIGAHVMNRLIDGLDKIDPTKFINYQSCQVLPNGDKVIFKQIAFFNNYIKCRMDYLSDISFGTPMMQTNKYAYNELFKELDKVRLLLEHISGLSNFKFKIKFKKNGESINDENDLLVAIPNDILGTQAFYNILENIIRNTAKHSDKSKLNGGEMMFTVNFIDNETEVACEDAKKILTDFIAVEVYDNVPVDSIEKLVIRQNNNLNNDILIDNKLRANSLGLVEMDASAAYLRKRDVGLINDSKYDIIPDESWQSKDGHKCFLKAFKKVDGQYNYLAYRFFMLRPAVVLVITDRECKNKNELKKQGIWIVTGEEFEKHLSSGKVYNHEFVVFVTDKESKIKNSIENNKTALPIRILEISQFQLVELLNSTDTNEKKILDIWEEFCWQKWNNKLKILYKINDEIYIGNSGGCEDEVCKCNKKGEFNAILLDHAKTDWLKYRYCKNVDYLDDMSSNSITKLPRLKIPPDVKNLSNYLGSLCDNTIQKTKLKESVITKILIIDERIQNHSQETYLENRVEKILYQEVYSKMGIILPLSYIEKPFFCEDNENPSMSRFNLSGDDICNEYGFALEKYINYHLTIFKKTDFIIFHYSILERIFKNALNKTNEINKFLESITNNDSPQIIITSGRGTLKDLTPKVRFVNLSPLITSFVETRSKYYGNHLLHSSRKNNST